MYMKTDNSAQITSQFFEVATGSIIGAKENQEDSFINSFALGQMHGFSVIADGMGGHASGEVASAIAASEVYAHLKVHSEDVASGSMNLPLVMREAVEAANARIAQHVKRYPASSGMGTTLLATVFSGRQLSWISVGDSPLLMFRDGALRRLNKDHSMAPQIDAMVKLGSLAEEVGRDHPDRHSLTSVVNGEEIAKVDCPMTPIMLMPGDVILSSTDGLQSISNAAIANIMAHYHNRPSTEIAGAFLAAIAKADDPGQDNVAFNVIKIGSNVSAASMIDAEEIPVLAVADEIEPEIDVPVPAAAPVAAPEPAAPVAEKPKKFYWYRGQKYLKED